MSKYNVVYNLIESRDQWFFLNVTTVVSKLTLSFKTITDLSCDMLEKLGFH